jgi:hypothetical protein
LDSLEARQLQNLRGKLAADDPELASALAAFAAKLLAQGKFPEAETNSRECLTIREKKMPDDWLTFNSRSVLGGSLLGQKKYADAEPFLLAGYEGLKQREDKIPANARSLRMKEALERLVQLYEATARPDQAAELKRALADLDAATTDKPSGKP